MILTAPVAPTLFRLAAPNILVMLVQAAMSVVDAFYLGWLGPTALAGVSLVFPVIMLMTTMSAGGLGGGISSAVARALGRRDRQQADVLAVHALVITAAFAALFTVGPLVAAGGCTRRWAAAARPSTPRSTTRTSSSGVRVLSGC